MATSVEIRPPELGDRQRAEDRRQLSSPGSNSDGRPVWPGIIATIVLVLVIGVGWWTGTFGEAFWWLTNSTPPAVHLNGPQGVVRGPVTIAAQIGPRARIVAAQVDDQPLGLNLPLIIDTASLPDGSHRVQV